MKKIIISSYDSRANPFYGGGGARAVHEIAKRLAKSLRVTVISSKYPGLTRKRDERDGVTYIFIGSEIRNPLLSQIIYILCLPIYVITSKFDVWIESFNPPVSSTFVKFFTGKPVIGLVHLLAGKPMSDKYGLSIFITAENIILNRYVNFIVLTETSQKEILRINPTAKVVLIPNGVVMPHLPVGQIDRRNWIYLGRIDENQKGLSLIIDAFERVKVKTDWQLVLSGNGSEKEILALKERINQSPVKNRIKYIGPSEGKLKSEFLKSAGVMVIASNYETFPLVILEAFANKCPVILPEIHDFEWVPDNIVRKTERTAISYAGSMSAMAGDRKLREKIAGQAYKYVKSYDWNKITKNYSNFIEALL